MLNFVARRTGLRRHPFVSADILVIILTSIGEVIFRCRASVVLSMHCVTVSTFICCPSIRSRTSGKRQAPATSAAMAVLAVKKEGFLLTVIQVCHVIGLLIVFSVNVLHAVFLLGLFCEVGQLSVVPFNPCLL